LWRDSGQKFKRKHNMLYGIVGHAVFLGMLGSLDCFPREHPPTASDMETLSQGFLEKLKKKRELSPEIEKEMVWPSFYVADKTRAYQFSVGAGVLAIRRGDFVTDGTGSEVAAGAILGAKAAGEHRGEGLALIGVEAAIKCVKGCGGKAHIERA